MPIIAAPQSHLLKIYSRPSVYPKVWKKERVQKVLLDWAGRFCENCGSDQEASLLHVHHLLWHDKHDCRFENLAVLCVGCHTAVHNRKYQPKPAIAWEERWGNIPQWLLVRGLHGVWEHPEHQPSYSEVYGSLNSEQQAICDRMARQYRAWMQGELVETKEATVTMDRPLLSLDGPEDTALSYFLERYA